jgi:hypothetical protein
LYFDVELRSANRPGTNNKKKHHRSCTEETRKIVPEQKKSVGERDSLLPLPLPEHIEENELESLGGSERRPSDK